MTYELHLYFFFLNDTATPKINTLSLHDALRSPPKNKALATELSHPQDCKPPRPPMCPWPNSKTDRKSTRLNSSHANISYAVFCLKKKKKYIIPVVRVPNTLTKPLMM